MLTWNDSDTICALSTPPGRGGIAVVRVSGPLASDVVRKNFPALPEQLESHKIYYGHFHDVKGETLDEVLVSYFAQGKSFTSQQTLEISCHGSPTIVDSILNALITSGARLARPGEFTFRAFMNGRIDLVQAESVLSLIESTTPAMQRLAVRQLEGDLSKELRQAMETLIYVLAHIEADIDFSTENLEVIDRKVIDDKLSTVTGTLQRLVQSYEHGRLAKDGLRVVLLGSPNAGKSSLLNFLMSEERSIVTPVAGTTRDFIEGAMMVDGHQVTLVDTAGLRDTTDSVEKIGVERSLAQAAHADMLFYLCDNSTLNKQDILDFEKYVGAAKTAVFVVTKSDLPASSTNATCLQVLRDKNVPVIVTSTVNHLGKEALLKMIGLQLESAGRKSADAIVLQSRHFAGITHALQAIKQAEKALRENLSSDLVSLDLRTGLSSIQEILGETANEAVIDKIFSEFCLGK